MENESENKQINECERMKLQCRGLPTTEKLAKCLETLGSRLCDYAAEGT
jgi:hypothetical protein